MTRAWEMVEDAMERFMIPKEWTKKFVAEHPTEATLIAVLGFVLLGFTMGVAFADWIGKS